eukprot:scaffold15793_cov111-Amphora_coffeaeformis.AAC.1
MSAGECRSRVMDGSDGEVAAACVFLLAIVFPSPFFNYWTTTLLEGRTTWGSSHGISVLLLEMDANTIRTKSVLLLLPTFSAEWLAVNSRLAQGWIDV